MTCNCRKCRVENFITNQEATGDGRHTGDWTGHAELKVMIVGPGGSPVPVATISIDAWPLIVEPQMANQVLIKAVKDLTQFIVNFSNGKTLN